MSFTYAIFATIHCCTAPAPAADVIRQDFMVTSEGDFRIFVRELRATEAQPDRSPMLLVNGGRSGVLASWDVNAPSSLVAEEFARAGMILAPPARLLAWGTVQGNEPVIGHGRRT